MPPPSAPDPIEISDTTLALRLSRTQEGGILINFSWTQDRGADTQVKLFSALAGEKLACNPTAKAFLRHTALAGNYLGVVRKERWQIHFQTSLQPANHRHVRRHVSHCVVLRDFQPQPSSSDAKAVLASYPCPTPLPVSHSAIPCLRGSSSKRASNSKFTFVLKLRQQLYVQEASLFSLL